MAIITSIVLVAPVTARRRRADALRCSLEGSASVRYYCGDGIVGVARPAAGDMPETVQRGAVPFSAR